ncbi:MAG: copper-binding protein [Alcaligenaceae bacterium]|nr:copper-binding protein [Alcaligenaceae bacterium]
MLFNWPPVHRAAAAAVVVVASIQSVAAYAQEANAAGEVRRIDAQAGKVTITQGEIPALQLPAMSLVYRIDPALLKDLKPGDKVRFTARRENGQYVIIRIAK